ncbi:MAG TPA: NAD(P)H-dependent oxidoreductase [Candidatus Binatia bacterium]|jgi:multimeric flavodoxin WrbA|nr:NAD(P)H-dependent oxidoreductase [Candidatus Binatia bacterium]
MATTAPIVRTGPPKEHLTRDEFSRRFRARFQDPAFEVADGDIARLESIAWDAYEDGRKAPRTRRAGSEFADPTYELSVDWLATRERLQAAAARHDEVATPTRVLIVSGSSRNDATCPGEISKTSRLVEVARETFVAEAVEVDVLDLSLLTSEYGRTIHPCKACVSTAMPLCHWPCSCYPNHALGQTNDWMAEIYDRWVLAHGVVIVTPVYWYGAPSGLKLMIDRLVCADGGNPDPTSTGGKNPALAKSLEVAGWPYPKHLAGRAYGVVVHGDVAGIESLRRGLSDWLDWMGCTPGGASATLDRYIGYYEPYATSHDALDRDVDLQEEVRNVARTVTRTMRGLRSGELVVADRGLEAPRPK